MTTSRTALCALAVSAALSALGAQAQDRLTVSTYGFGLDNFKELLFGPFEEVCGCEVVIETGNSIERMAKIEANAANPVIDMAVMSSHDALSLARKGLLERIDTSRLSNHPKLYGIAKDPIGGNMAVGYTFYATSIVYRDDLVDIDSWADLLSDELAGRVAFPDVTTTQGPIALYMLGKALGDDSPGFETPLSGIAGRRDDIVTFYVRSSQLAQLMEQEEVIAAPVGRFAWSRFSGSEKSFAWASPKEGQTGGLNVMIMTKGNGNEDLVYRFMDYWLSTEVQTRIAMAGIDSPANTEVEVPPDVAAGLTYGQDQIDAINILDPAVIIDNRDGWIDAWNSTVIQ